MDQQVRVGRKQALIVSGLILASAVCFYLFVERPTGTFAPSDCYWWTAPVGDKRCHYEKIVEVYNAAGQRIDGNQVLKGRSREGLYRTISYDSGKVWFSTVGWTNDDGVTWHLDDHIIDWTPSKVAIFWNKVREP